MSSKVYIEQVLPTIKEDLQRLDLTLYQDSNSSYSSVRNRKVRVRHNRIGEVSGPISKRHSFVGIYSGSWEKGEDQRLVLYSTLYILFCSTELSRSVHGAYM